MKKTMCAAAMAVVLSFGAAIGTAPVAQASQTQQRYQPSNPLCRIWHIWC